MPSEWAALKTDLRGIIGMARRPFHDEPMSKLAIWSSRLALFALAVAALSIIIVRSGLLEIVPALATFAAALVFAGLAILLAFARLRRDLAAGPLRPRTRAARSVSRAGAARLPGLSRHARLKLPAISDITTDTANPPRFDVLARLRPRGRTDYPGAAVAALQRAAYPDIVPLSSTCRPRSPMTPRSRL